MKFEDDSQNLRMRLGAIQVLVFVMLGLLGARLYYLQVIKGSYYAERAENQQVRQLKIPAPRGVIFDRNGRLLVDSSPIYNVILSREDIKGRDFRTLIEPLADGLGIDAEILHERFQMVQSQPAFESVKVKEDASPADIAWVESHRIELPEVRVEMAPRRRYPEDGVLAHVLGYVGEISPSQLERSDYKERGHKPGDIIGQSGLEASYDQYLRGRDGYRRVIVDSHGRIQDELEIVPPQPGQDLVTTIDLDLQLVAEEQLRNSPSKRGAIISLDPNNGEILSMASSPSFDPNVLSQTSTSKEARRAAFQLLQDPLTPLTNRAIQGRYPPGSTWKILMSVAGLRQGAISIQNSNLVCGGGVQVGNKFTRCYGGNHGTLGVRRAIHVSCDGYFYRLGLKMKLDGIMEMVDEFDLNKRTGIDLPNEKISWTPSRELKRRFNPHNPEWKDIDTVYASFGQATDIMTPISMLRAEAAVGVGGKLYVPHILKEARAVGEPGTPDYRPAKLYNHREPKVIPIAKDQHRIVIDGMWDVVNTPGGTGYGIRMDGFDIAGKTGTAQVVSRGKEGKNNKDHSWFVSFAPAYKPEVAIISIIENVGFGGRFSAPAVRALYDVYYRKSRNEEPPGAQIAQATKATKATKAVDRE